MGFYRKPLEEVVPSYAQIKLSSDNNGGILHMDAGTPSIPGTPSVIATLTQIA